MAQVSTQNNATVSTKNAKAISDEFRAKQEQTVKLDQALSEVPASVARIDRKIAADNPSLTFVVIKEMHVNEVLPKETKEAGLRCQSEVHAVLSKINEKLGGFNVLKDGMDPDIAKSYTDRIDHVYKHADTAKTLEEALKTNTSAKSEALLTQLRKTNADGQIINAVGFLMEYQQNREKLFEEAKKDSVINLALRRVISLSGPENKALVEDSIALAKNNPSITVDAPEFKALSDKREKHIVDKVAKEKGPTVVGVFGGSHDFSEEIQAWNKNNPDKKISLIEIVPAEYVKYYKE